MKPDATPDEVAAVVNDETDGGGQIFAQAVSFYPLKKSDILIFCAAHFVDPIWGIKGCV